MKKIVIVSLLFINTICAIEIDVPFVTQQAKMHPSDIGNRVLLLKHYMNQHDYAHAKVYCDEILKIDPRHEAMQKIQKQITLIQALQITSGNSQLSVHDALKDLLAKQKIMTFLDYYEGLQETGMRGLEDLEMDAAWAYYWAGDIEKSEMALSKCHDNHRQRATELREKLRLESVKKSLLSKPNKSNIENFVYLLNKEKNPKKTINALKKFVKKNPTVIEAKIALSQHLYWDGALKEAFHKLYPIRQENRKTKTLYAQILYDMKDYEHALYYLPEVSRYKQNKTIKYDLEKKMAFAYQYVGKEAKAQKLFKKMLGEHPKDKELIAYHDNMKQNTLLDDAHRYQHDKDDIHALENYVEYYRQTKNPKIAKEIAEIYYFNQKGTLALPYFEAYLSQYPHDSLLRYHYASVYEKEKNYQQSVTQLKQVVQDTNAPFILEAQYHYAHSLMQTHQDTDWLQARVILEGLVKTLAIKNDKEHQSLRKYTKDLYKVSQGKIRKPTRYKDIILTEGSYKVLKAEDVFSFEQIQTRVKPTMKSLLHIGQESRSDKSQVWMGLDYANDSAVTYHNAKIGVNNIFEDQGIKYGLHVEQFDFKTNQKQYDGLGIFAKAQKDNFSLSLGVEHFDDFDTLVPRLTWNPKLDAHNMYLEAYYRNGAFINYRDCMIKKELGVYHFGLYDSILMDDLRQLELGVDINSFEDDNTNINGQLTYPLWMGRLYGMTHKIVFNENIEYNSKTDVCYSPLEFYDTSYLKYKPKWKFSDGFVELSVGSGYAFKNKEVVYSYGLNADYTIIDFVTVGLSCEQLKSSFSADNMTFCQLNVIQAW